MNLPMRQATLKVVFSRRMLVAFLMGFSGGLPLLLTMGVLQAWMKEGGVDLTWIGMITLVQIPYTWKFLWAPFLDRFVPPFLGRRRGWLLMSQIALIASIVGLGYSDPVKNTTMMVVTAFLVAFFTDSSVLFTTTRKRLSAPTTGVRRATATAPVAYSSANTPGTSTAVATPDRTTGASTCEPLARRMSRV